MDIPINQYRSVSHHTSHTVALDNLRDSWREPIDSDSNSEDSTEYLSDVSTEAGEDSLGLHNNMANDEPTEPRELTPKEVNALEKFNRWKTNHMHQVTEGKSLPVLKGSLTRVKGHFD